MRLKNILRLITHPGNNKYSITKKYTLITLILIKLIIDAYLVATSSKLRIIADDYCNAGTVNENGILGAAFNYYTNWSGFFTTNFITSLYFGITNNLNPKFFPIGLIIIIYVITMMVFYKILSDSIPKNQGIIYSSILSSFFLVIIVTNGFGTTAGGYIYFIGWGTVAIAWTMPSLLLILYILQLSKFDKSRKSLFFFIWMTIFTVALAGTNLQISLIALIILAILLCKSGLGLFKGNRTEINKVFFYLFQIIVLLPVLFLSIFSPGSRKRSSNFSENLQNFSIIRFLRFLKDDAWSSLNYINSINWIQIIFLGIFLGALFRFLNSSDSKLVLEKVKQIRPLSVLILTLITIFINSLLNFFSYTAKWHLIPLFILVLIILFLAGLILGLLITQFNFSNITFIFMITIITFTIFSFQLRNAKELIQDREKNWSLGIAVPYDEIGDIEVVDGWIANCKNKILELRINERSR